MCCHDLIYGYIIYAIMVFGNFILSFLNGGLYFKHYLFKPDKIPHTPSILDWIMLIAYFMPYINIMAFILNLLVFIFLAVTFARYKDLFDAWN